MTKVLVTGGVGFIGSHIVDRMLQEGFEVIVLDDFSSGNPDNLATHARLEIIEGSIECPPDVEHVMEGVDTVFHQAARSLVPRSLDFPAECMQVNVEGTANVLAAAIKHQVRRVVYASSSSVYGDWAPLPTHERATPDPVSPYAVSKLAAEHLCRAWSYCFGLETVSLRYFNVYGPRQRIISSNYGLVVPKFLDMMQRGEPPTIYGDGLQTRDFTHVSDVVEANFAAMTAKTPANRGLYCNVGSGTSHTILALVEMLNAALNTEIKPVHLPARTGDVRDTAANIRMATESLGWEPKMALRDGLKALVAG